MKVRELIEELSKYDGETEILGIDNRWEKYYHIDSEDISEGIIVGTEYDMPDDLPIGTKYLLIS